MKFFKSQNAKVLISEEDMISKLMDVFVDCIILDKQFEIVLTSKNILHMLEFELDELNGKDINYLSKDINLRHLLQQELDKGYFEEMIVNFYSKRNDPVTFSLSGFSLAMVCPLDNYFVLKLNNLEMNIILHQQLNSNRAELDKFIYRTAHDLRGPLATVQGLINLMKMRKNNDEVDTFLQMINTNTTKLDDILFKLLYLAESGEANKPVGYLRLNDLETFLHNSLVENCADKVSLTFVCSQEIVYEYNEQLITALMNNVMLYLIGLPLQNDPYIKCDIVKVADGLEIKVESEGFKTGYQLRQAIHQKSSVYTNMLTYPYLVHYYAAQKVVQKMNGFMHVVFNTEEAQILKIFIPAMGAPENQS